MTHPVASHHLLHHTRWNSRRQNWNLRSFAVFPSFLLFPCRSRWPVKVTGEVRPPPTCSIPAFRPRAHRGESEFLKDAYPSGFSPVRHDEHGGLLRTGKPSCRARSYGGMNILLSETVGEGIPRHGQSSDGRVLKVTRVLLGADVVLREAGNDLVHFGPTFCCGPTICAASPMPRPLSRFVRSLSPKQITIDGSAFNAWNLPVVPCTRFRDAWAHHRRLHNNTRQERRRVEEASSWRVFPRAAARACLDRSCRPRLHSDDQTTTFGTGAKCLGVSGVLKEAVIDQEINHTAPLSQEAPSAIPGPRSETFGSVSDLLLHHQERRIRPVDSSDRGEPGTGPREHGGEASRIRQSPPNNADHVQGVESAGRNVDSNHTCVPEKGNDDPIARQESKLQHVVRSSTPEASIHMPVMVFGL